MYFGYFPSFLEIRFPQKQAARLLQPHDVHIGINLQKHDMVWIVLHIQW